MVLGLVPAMAESANDLDWIDLVVDLEYSDTANFLDNPNDVVTPWIENKFHIRVNEVIQGGLTTIEEKALGNIQKIGTKAPVIGTLDKAVTPTGPGLWFMDSSSAAAEMITLVAAAGYVVHFFPTGQGNIIGNPIVPVIKLSANPRTIRTMSEHMDVDVSGILRREMNLDQAGDKLLDMMFQTIAGRMTAAEALKQNQFVMTRLYESA